MNLRYARRSEDTEQIAVITWAHWEMAKHPELELLHHCPNGGSRNKAEAVKFKQMGVKAGIPDLCLPVPKGIYAGLYIEMKYGNGRLEESQKDALRKLAAVGHYCAVCYTADEAIETIKEYISLAASQSEIGKSEMLLDNLTIRKEGKTKALK